MEMIKRTATVSWKGGANAITQVNCMESLLMKRFRVIYGIPLKTHADPVELLAAAHAGSFSLALAKELEPASFSSGVILTTATATSEHLNSGWTVTRIHLNVTAQLPGLTQGEFVDATVHAKTTCIMTRLLRANVSMHAKLEMSDDDKIIPSGSRKKSPPPSNIASRTVRPKPATLNRVPALA
jgi:osmotically inducible protein OsmC